MKYFTAVFLLLAVVGCKYYSKTAPKGQVFTPNNTMQGPRIVVYKTKKDYSKYVPAILNESKTKVFSWFHPQDLTDANGKPKKPTSLRKKYWLDVVGVSKNLVYLNITLDDYLRGDTAISPETVMQHILEKNPVVEMYDCGCSMGVDSIEYKMNRLIKDKKLSTVCTLVQ